MVGPMTITFEPRASVDGFLEIRSLSGSRGDASVTAPHAENRLERAAIGRGHLCRLRRVGSIPTCEPRFYGVTTDA